MIDRECGRAYIGKKPARIDRRIASRGWDDGNTSTTARRLGQVDCRAVATMLIVEIVVHYRRRILRDKS